MEISGISTFLTEIFAYNTLLPLFAVVLAVQLRLPGTQALSSNTLVSATISLHFCSDLWRNACPVFTQTLLRVISASAQEVQPLSNVTVSTPFFTFVGLQLCRLLWGVKNLHHHLLLGGNRNSLGFLQRSAYPSHFTYNVFPYLKE